VTRRRGAVGAGLVLAAALSMAGAARTPTAVDVWLDVDTAMGPVAGRPRDVDDGLALVQALASPELRVAGIGVVFGNAPLGEAVVNTQRIVERFAPGSVGVYAGAASAGDLGRDTAATRALADALRRTPLTMLALGPVTNVATVVQQHPDLRSRIRQVVLVAARRPGFDFHPVGRPELKFPDANFEHDVAGLRVLLDADLPLVFAGYESSSDVWLTRAHLDEVAASGANGAWVREQSLAWLDRWERTLGLPGFNPFDTLAVGWVVHPDWFTSVRVRAHITSGPDDRLGTGPAAGRPSKAYLVGEPEDGGTAPHLYLTGAAPDFVPWLVRRLAAR
jgi:pyrimidine-specific ribonucleoside hydrolase